MTKTFKYKPKSRTQLQNDYNRRRRGGNNGFDSFNDFANWYDNKEKKCHYCGVLEIECQEIVMRGLLTSRRFPHNGIITQGRSRGVWLEVDRLNPNGLYSGANCVLACYFCNNDKSDVFNGVTYPQFFQNRVAFLGQLLQNNP
jgi:hypothetical protein